MEKTFYFARAFDGDYLLDSFPHELKYLLTNDINPKNKISIKYLGATYEARIGTHSNDKMVLTIVTIEDNFVKRYKFFKELLESSLVYIGPLLNLEEAIKAKNNEILMDFIHNVTSINSYSIQNLFALIPQKNLADNINKQKEIVRDIIKDKPNRTIDTLLKEIKYSIATKVEFSVFENILNKKSIFLKEKHIIRNVVLSILQIFIDDFDQKRITISLAASDKSLEIDYDSISVSLYYIFDNAVKYCHPNTEIKIIFSEEGESFDIIIKMVSIKIEEREIGLLTIRGYRSDFAKQINCNGQGIGMSRIVKTLELNKSELVIIPNAFKFSKINKGVMYEGNEFRIKFKGQQDWFK
ncbi:ATP-binding protein [Elizabethkingia bruuniana]|uniref:ATP-binding protein n=1 Tax=Elizabethkingia TaxID=308865 RepID=UPI000999BCC2|nr:ATP-binding protein [Elizabethkingia bruuniana]OPC62433.1 hypothetical protein BAY13_06325 [Elizabethkingia bruuniana]